MLSSRHLLAALSVCLLLALSARAERVPLGPEEKKAEATDIVTGKVKAVYSRDVETTLYGKGTVETHYLLELEVASVEKGERLKKGALAYARCWSLKKVGDQGQRPGPSGHFGIPKEGDEIRAFLAYGKYPPTGQGDNGYAVVYPNGIENVDPRRKK